MAVRRIVTNIASAQVEAARSFYGDVLGLEVVMDLGWILTFAAQDASAAPQISIAREGGSGTPVPDISVEVDDLEEVYRRAAAASLPIEYGPTQEPWGVRRFYVRDRSVVSSTSSLTCERLSVSQVASAPQPFRSVQIFGASHRPLANIRHAQIGEGPTDLVEKEAPWPEAGSANNHNGVAV